ncbi:predicted protein [Phaeodactylum tricornutum CCAP 1055/1]|jgi:hypothetical protein|uniref:Uncharacterized protein n=3 Tax=Phaeodactylum tricornutum TaxID=2850 RepID=B7FWJ9_PHATC|nr:predicted protein [Phaeodactylum tricornutum CCAP 1055/1]EEC49218.1 predicted protein [Phaeodactylum tricornutum CCAP 1055/1]|eukprot:XP_002179395.1 predicted protein [Phaeodactylum tricornutum CCAP 1055/1]
MKVFFVFVILSAFFSMIYAKTVKERLMDFRHVSDTEPSPEALAALQAHDNKRMSQLQVMIEDRRRQLMDHKNGRRHLNVDEHATVADQADVYTRKLAQMRSETALDKEEKLREMIDSFKHMNRMDYIDFGKSGLDG